MLLTNVLERTFFLNKKENYQIKTLLEVVLIFSRILFAVSVALEYDISDRFTTRNVGRDGLKQNCAMTVKKLSNSDKQEILNLYRQTGETTSTLAERYSVSNSTISRLLKSILPEEEYEALIASKRAARTSGGGTTSDSPLFSEPELDILVNDEVIEVEPREDAESTPDSKRLRRRSSVSNPEEMPANSKVQLQLLDTPRNIEGSKGTGFAQNAPIQDLENEANEVGNSASELAQNAPIQDLDNGADEVGNSAPVLNRKPVSQPVIQPKRLDRPVSVGNTSTLDEVSDAEANTLAEMLGEELLDSEELLELEEDEDLDEDDLERDTSMLTRRMPSEMLVQVLPLSEATLPKTCYLVIDRASELITRPLRDFGDLGQIPTQEVQQKTLPVFDNHRVARRFSTKRDRVIKVPDSRMLKKARSHLQAKGITRLLVDGQVYSLLPDLLP
jgi:transposase-like protein